MATTYTKSLAIDFGGNINLSRFRQTIIDDGTITTQLNNIESNGDVISITFAAALAAFEIIQLDALIAIHDGVSAEPLIDFINTGALNTVATFALAPTTNRTFTLPDATTEIVGTDTNQVLTSKTLTTPRINTSILDTNGNAIINFIPAASAVNAITISNSATGVKPSIAATGTDADIDIDIVPKGTGIINMTGDVIMTGNLAVSGTTSTVDTKNIRMEDNHIYLNKDYTVASAQTGGLVINYLPTTHIDSINGVFTAGVAATSNPTVITTGSATYTIGQIIQIDSANNPENDGIFEVLSHIGTTLTIRGVGTTATIEDFTQNQFITDSVVVGNITRITVSVLRAGVDGIWESGKGSSTGIIFDNMASEAATQTLTNKTITMSGNLTMSGNDITIPDNTADAFSIVEGATKYITLDTTDGDEEVNILKSMNITRYTATVNNITISTNYSISKHESQIVMFVAAINNNIVILPDATSLPQGWQIEIFNDEVSTSILKIQDNDTNQLYTTGVGGYIRMMLINNTTSAGSWEQAMPHYHKILNVSIEGGDFNSVKEAIDSITDNSMSNQYVINVSAGTFVEDAITMKEYVTIIGTGVNSTQIVAASTTQTMITGVRYSALRQMTLSGASGVGGICIYMTDAASTTVNPTFAIANIEINTCETCVQVVGAISFANICSVVITSSVLKAPFVNGIINTGNVGIAVCSLTVSRILGGPTTLNAIKNEGPGGNMACGVVNIQGSNTGNGILLRTGAAINIGTSKIQNMTTAINVENSGTGSKLEVVGVITTTNTADLFIDQTTAVGSVTGVFERSKTTVNSPDIVVLYQDPINHGTVMNGDIYIGQTIATVANVTDLISGASMGLKNGGVISQGIGDLEIDITNGFGYTMISGYDANNDGHQIKRVEWVVQSLTLPADAVSYIHINSSGLATYTPTEPNSLYNIILGRVKTTGTITLYEITPVTAVADVSGSLNNKYFTINSPGVSYYVWFNVSSGGTDPAIALKTGIEVAITTDDTANTIAGLMATAINANADFSVPAPGAATITITNAKPGNVNDATAGDSGFTIGSITQGDGVIEFIEPSRFKAHHVGNFNNTYINEIMGSKYVSGSTVTSNASREIAITAGVYYYGGTRYTPSGLASPATFYQYNRTAGVWGFAAATVVNNTQYDNGTNLVSLTASYYVRHLLFIVGSGTTERYMLVIGQEEYLTETLARDGNIPNPPTYFSDGVSTVVSFIMQQGVSTVVDILDERPRLASAAAGSAGISDHGSLTGLGNDDHTQYLLTSGSRAMSGPLNMGSNNITNVGTINTINIAAHAARHGANGGADALSTAAPITNIGAGTSNDVGTANTFARSDHQHGLDSSVIVQTGAQTLTDKTLVSTTNNIAAKSLHSATTVVDVVSAAAPTAGQVLTATSSTFATWQNKSVAGWKDAVRVATTQDLGSTGTGYAYANTNGAKTRGQITWSAGPSTIDGITLIDGDRILVKNNTVGASNGIWVRTSANVWDRAIDFDDDHDVKSLSTLWVSEGVISGQLTYYLTTVNPIIIGGVSGTSLAFQSFQLSVDNISCQARRTTTLTLSTVYTSLLLDLTDVANDTSIISHSVVTNTEQMVIGETGLYQIEYFLYIGTSNNNPMTADTRLFLNNTSLILGSTATSIIDSAAGSSYQMPFNRKVSAILTAGDYVAVQARCTDASFVLSNAVVIVTRLRGTRGANGINGTNGTPGDIVWSGIWNGATTYTANQAVELNGSTYVCVLGHTNQAPPNITYWNLVASKGDTGAAGDIVWLGAWSGATAYVNNDTVSSNGSSYKCIAANTNQVPPNGTFWDLVASKGDTGNTGPAGATGDITWFGAWSAVVTYVPNNAVTINGSSYVCILGHTNQTPPNGTYWDILSSKGDTGLTGATGPAGTITTISLSAGTDVSSVTTTSIAVFGAMVDVIAGMTTTPAAGTYVIAFSASVSLANKAQFGQLELYVGGISVQHTRRTISVGTNGDKTIAYTQAQVVVTGVEAVEMRYSATGASGFSAFGRSLILTKVA